MMKFYRQIMALINNFVILQRYNIKLSMPEISRFFGIIIAMFTDDHNPPHFHVRYGDYQAIVTIKDGIVKGELPKHVLKQVFQWMEEHEQELIDNWQRLQNGEQARKIESLS